jgi:hypothetical protein
MTKFMYLCLCKCLASRPKKKAYAKGVLEIEVPSRTLRPVGGKMKQQRPGEK